MASYWRLKDIPELHDVAVKDRRECWREAVSRSNTRRGVLAMMGLCMVGYLSADAIAALLGYHSGPIHLGSMFVGAVLAGIVNDHWLTQPRARHWLRMHVGSDGRYIETESTHA